jgi:hypothetical protein
MATKTQARKRAVPHWLKDRVRQVLAELRPGEWLTVSGGDYIVRCGMPLDTDDHARLTQRPISGSECEVCGSGEWVAVTRVDGKDSHGHERLADRLLCRTCGGSEIADFREEITK